MRGIAVLIGIALCITACSAPSSEVEASSRPPLGAFEPGASLDRTGILLIGSSEQVRTTPHTEALRVAFGEATALIEAHPDDLGYAWIDPSKDELVVSASTTDGQRIWASAPISVPHRVRRVVHSAAELRRIQDDATALQSQRVRDADLILMTMPDQRDNRAMIVIRAPSRQLLDELAARFPADALAIQVHPDSQQAGT